jgi:hypothetical protein
MADDQNTPTKAPTTSRDAGELSSGVPIVDPSAATVTATRELNVRIEYRRSIRSAITVAGIIGRLQ